MGREEMLQNVPIFSELGRRDLGRLAKLMVPRAVKGGEVIIKEGDQAAGFFVVSSGKLEAVRGDGANEQHLANYGAGDFFGEMALLDHQPHSASIRAVTPVKLFVILQSAFEMLCAENAVFRNELKIISERRKFQNLHPAK